MIRLSEFLPGIRREISGPLNIMMTDAARQSAITFCRESLCCRRTLVLNPAAGEVCPLVGQDDPVTCVRILRIFSPSGELFPGADVQLRAGSRVCFTDSHEWVELTFAFAPRADASQVPDALQDNEAVIVDGALSGLFMQTGKPWQDTARGLYFQTRFIEGYRRVYRETLEMSPVSPFRNPVRRQRFY